MIHRCLLFAFAFSTGGWGTEAFSLHRKKVAVPVTPNTMLDIEKVTSPLRHISPVHGEYFCTNEPWDAVDRRDALAKGALAVAGALLLDASPPVSPAFAKAARIKPDEAFANLVKAREELSVAYKTYVIKKDYDGLRQYLADDAVNMNNYEENAGILLASKSLDAESKIAIGTVRRYGVGADVIIMYGGLKGELAEDIDVEDINYGAVSKAISKAMDSLDEVIAICRSNGFK